MASVLIEVLPTDSVVLPKIVKCPGDTIIFGQNVSSPGIFSKKFQNANGCDSTVFVEIQFRDEPKTADQVTICFGDTAFVNGGSKGEAMIEIAELKDDEGVLEVAIGDKIRHDCPACTLAMHERDAAHCKRCGASLFPEGEARPTS